MVLILISIDPATPPTIFGESENEAEKCLNKNCHRKHIKPKHTLSKKNLLQNLLLQAPIPGSINSYSGIINSQSWDHKLLIKVA